MYNPLVVHVLHSIKKKIKIEFLPQRKFLIINSKYILDIAFDQVKNAATLQHPSEVSRSSEVYTHCCSSLLKPTDLIKQRFKLIKGDNWQHLSEL